MLPAQSLTELSVLPVTDVLAWVVVGVFLLGVLADRRERRDLARRVTAGAWALFAVFWLLLIHQFAAAATSTVSTMLRWTTANWWINNSQKTANSAQAPAVTR